MPGRASPRTGRAPPQLWALSLSRSAAGAACIAAGLGLEAQGQARSLGPLSLPLWPGLVAWAGTLGISGPGTWRGFAW